MFRLPLSGRRDPRALDSRRPFYPSAPPRLGGAHHRTRSRRSGRLAALVAAMAAAALAGCDASSPDRPTGAPPPLPTASADQQALVAQAFEDVELLFALGFEDGARPAGARLASAEHGTRKRFPFDVETVSLAGALGTAARMAVDTTTYTGVYDAANTRGYLVQMQYRQPQGVGVWTARVQHGRTVTEPTGGTFSAVETVTLTFLDYPALETFVSDLASGSIPYLTGASQSAEASFASFDTWRVAQVYSPAEGTAVVSYANAALRESITVREPVVTLNTNGTGTVRDGGPGGSVRTRYYGADFAVSATGVVSGTLLRTLTSAGDAADGSVVSRSDYPDASFRQTRQRGGDGVVVRENTQG